MRQYDEFGNCLHVEQYDMDTGDTYTRHVCSRCGLTVGYSHNRSVDSEMRTK